MLARQLCELNQHRTALEYLKMIKTKTLGVLFAKVLCMAFLGQSLKDESAFSMAAMALINETLLLSQKDQKRVVLRQACLTNRPNKDDIVDKIERVSENSRDARLQYLLLCANELSSPEVIKQGGPTAERFSAFFILSCLKIESQA